MNYFIIIDAVTLILGIYIIFVSLRMKKNAAKLKVPLWLRMR